MTIRYALLHIRRSYTRSLAVLAVSLAFVLLLITLCSARTSQQQQLESILSSMPVPAVVSDIYGTRTDNLGLSNIYIQFVSAGDSPLAEYIKDACIRRAMECRLADASGTLMDMAKVKLIGATYLSSDSIYSEENGIHIRYFDGYDEAILNSSEPVCLVNEKLFAQLGENMDTLWLDFTDVADARKKEIESAAAAGIHLPGGGDVPLKRVKIAGLVTGGSSDILFCPWSMMGAIDQTIYGEVSADAISFTVANNREINALKDLLPTYFSQVSPGAMVNPHAPPSPAIIINDATLVRVAAPIERNIQFLKVIIPMLLILSLSIGFLASFLTMRNRTAEFAIMRSLGTRQGKVFGTALLEQLAICALGTISGLSIAAITNSISSEAVLYSCAFFMCFALGAAIAAGRLVSVNVIDIMKAKE